MRSFLLLLIIFGSIPLILVKPHIGALLWAWVSYFNPHRLTWALTYDFPVAVPIGIATLVGWMLSREPKKLPAHGVSYLLIALAFWISVTTLFALVPEQANWKWIASMKLLAMTMITIALINTRQRLNLLVWVIVLSIGFYGVKGGVFSIAGGAENLVFGPPGTFLGDNNSLAMALIMVIPWMRYLSLQAPNPWVKRAMLVALLLTVAAVVGTYSRGALLALLVMVAFLVIKSRQRALFGLILIGTLAFGATLLPEKWMERMETIASYEVDASAIGRFQAWTFAYKLALDRPITGGGFEANWDTDRYLKYVPEAGRPRAAHSVYFEVLGEHGFVGLGIFLLLWLLSYRACSVTIRATRGNPEMSWANDLARMTQVGLVGYAAAGVFQNLAFFDLYYHFIAVALLVNVIAVGQVARAAPKIAPEPEGPADSRVSATGGAVEPTG